MIPPIIYDVIVEIGLSLRRAPSDCLLTVSHAQIYELDDIVAGMLGGLGAIGQLLALG